MSIKNKDTDFSSHDLIEVEFFKDYLALEPKILEHRTSALPFDKNENYEHLTYLIVDEF